MVEAKFNADEFPDYLTMYYKRLFPYGPYYKWLTYGLAPQGCFALREFSFTLRDDVYIRYLSFDDQQQMEKEIQKKNPYKIDIGAICNHKPRDHKMIGQGGFKYEQKELVFDIDLTDYDEVRYCCQGSDICSKCWPFMSVTVKVLDRALRQDFGFKHLLWVYSGRRGIHCWVCDESARKLNQEARTSIVEYLSLVKGGADQAKKVNLKDPPHPFVEASLVIVRDYFDSLALGDQDIMGSDERLESLLKLIPDDSLTQIYKPTNKNNPRAELHKKLCESGNDSKSRWDALVELHNDRSKNFKVKQLINEIMLQYIYPRLDVNVSTGVNHLLKSPFCVHPKTGRVCVPIDPKNVDAFRPESAPIIVDVIKDMDEIKDEPQSEIEVDEKENIDATQTMTQGRRRPRYYNKTRLRPSISIFEEFLEKLSADWKGNQLSHSDNASILNF